MHASTVLFAALFASLSQQFTELEHAFRLKHRHAMIHARQSGQDLSFCFGETAICAQSNTLFENCNAFEGDSDLTQWYECLCGNGYVTSDTECDWCQQDYGLSYLNNEDMNESACTQYNGGTIAPIPSSILLALSAFNASYTGVVSGPAANPTQAVIGSSTTPSSAEVASTKSPSETVRSTSATSHTTQSASNPFAIQSSLITETLNGGSPGTLTAAPTSNQGGVETTASTTAKSGTVRGLNTGMAVAFSVLAFGVSVWCLL